MTQMATETEVDGNAAASETLVLERIPRSGIPSFAPETMIETGSNESHYIHFFHEKFVPLLPYFNIFPTMISDTFQRFAVDPGLYHTVLSVSHFIADSHLRRSLQPAHHHKQQALLQLQSSLSALEVTESVALSVALLLWLDLNLVYCSRSSSQHLQGLYLIMQELKGQQSNPSPLLMQIWRVAIRLEINFTIFCFPLRPIFPPATIGQEELHRSWVRASVKSEMQTEWVLASFALDDLIHRAGHVATMAYELRRELDSNAAELQILDWTADLLREHAQWRSRPAIIIADGLERQAEEKPGKVPRFLEYPPLSIHNTFFAHLLNAWRALYIFIDLIAFPEVGPRGNDSRRFKAAVDICRTYEALRQGYMFPISTVMTVFLSGLAFGGSRRSPREMSWLIEKMCKPIEEYYSLNKEATVLDFLDLS
jgi:hypothetical protein